MRRNRPLVFRIIVTAALLFFPEPEHLILKVLLCIGLVAVVEYAWRSHFSHSDNQARLYFPSLPQTQIAGSGHMARRPEVSKSIMTENELADLKRRLSLLSPQHVQEEYKAQVERCRLQGEVPPPYMIQRLVTIWKVLWKMKR